MCQKDSKVKIWSYHICYDILDGLLMLLTDYQPTEMVLNFSKLNS